MGHTCRNKGINLIILGEDEGNNEEEEVIEYQGTVYKQDVELSLHSLIGNLLSSTIKIVGKAQRSEISILIDGGSTHCFIKKTVAQK